MKRCLAALGLVAAFGPALPALADGTGPSHGIAMHGEPLYPADFDHLSYADPDAPRGGTLVQAATGTFDSLNPFIVIGRTAAGVRAYHFASLMERSWDEPFSLYGYVARSIETPADRSWVAFRLNPDARFHDGTPITVDDVQFTMETLREHGTPGFRRNYDRIASVERIGDDGIRFTLNDEADRETPMIIALMPVLSRAYYTQHPIDRTSLDIPLGSGPYRISAVDPGRSIAFSRVEDWWADDLPVFRGMHNFTTLRFDYYRDTAIAIEAFKSGEYNFRRETSAEAWATDYDFPAARRGDVTLLEWPHHRPEGMSGFVFNSRRALFADPRVRRALIYAFDFEWINRTLLYGRYRRADSYFANSDLASHGLPEGAELALLEPLRDIVPAAAFTEPYTVPATDGSGRARDNLRTARDLLQDAGWTIDRGTLVDGDGRPFAFEILLNDPSDERIALAYADTLQRLGIQASVRTVDTAQYTARTATFDFDMIRFRWPVTLSPGAEQNLYWGSGSAATEGSRNYAGVEDAAVDALIGALEDARDRDALVAAARALDRVLLWGNYVVPLYYDTVDRIAFWGDLDWVRDADPLYGLVVESMWQVP